MCPYWGRFHSLDASLDCRLTMAPTPTAARAAELMRRLFVYSMSIRPTCSVPSVPEPPELPSRPGKWRWARMLGALRALSCRDTRNRRWKYWLISIETATLTPASAAARTIPTAPAARTAAPSAGGTGLVCVKGSFCCSHRAAAGVCSAGLSPQGRAGRAGDTAGSQDKAMLAHMYSCGGRGSHLSRAGQAQQTAGQGESGQAQRGRTAAHAAAGAAQVLQKLLQHEGACAAHPAPLTARPSWPQL